MRLACPAFTIRGSSSKKVGVCFLGSLCSFVLSVRWAFIGLMHAFPYSNVCSKYSSLSHPGQASPCRCRSSSHLPTQGAAVHPRHPCNRAFPLRLLLAILYATGNASPLSGRRCRGGRYPVVFFRRLMYFPFPYLT